MSLVELLEAYVYAAVFIGSLPEGETVLVLAGVYRSRGIDEDR